MRSERACVLHVVMIEIQLASAFFEVAPRHGWALMSFTWINDHAVLLGSVWLSSKARCREPFLRTDHAVQLEF